MIKIDNDADLAELAELIRKMLEGVEEYDGNHEILRYRDVFDNYSLTDENGTAQIEVEFIQRFKKPGMDIKEVMVEYLHQAENVLFELREEEDKIIEEARTGSGILEKVH